MVFRRENNITHSGALRSLRPFLRIEPIRLELVDILLILFIRHFQIGLHPFIPECAGIDAPVNEHSEFALFKPMHTLFSFL